MSEVLTAQQCTSTVLPPPQAQAKPSWARKRPAAAGLRPISDLALAEPPRVPSSLSLSPDLSAGDSSGDDDSQTEQLKRSRHDSGISTLSDESDSQSSLTNYVSTDFSLGSAESQASSSLSKAPYGLFVHNCQIGEFRVIGAGRDAKAFNATGEIFDARILTDSELTIVTRVLARLDQAEDFYPRIDVEEMKNTILPAKTQIIEETSGRVVMFTPVFQKSLHTYAQERGVEVTEAELQPVFEQIIKLMAFCHSIGIIIRDLKPRKLVFDVEGKIRLHHVRDCVVLDDPYNDTVYEKFGSPAYVQPEVLNAGGAGYSGKAADMWSLGVLMYLLLLGRYPFFDKTPIGVLQRIMQARVCIPMSCQISKYAKILLYSLLRKSPEDRPSAEQLFSIPWGHPKTLPSRGHGDRMLPRRLLDELMNFDASDVRPAVPLDSELGVASPPADADNILQIFQSARNIITDSEYMRAFGLRRRTDDPPSPPTDPRLLVNRLPVPRRHLDLSGVRGGVRASPNS